MSSQTRLGERLPILGRLSGDITVVEPMTVKELGAGGALIETRFALVIDSLHELRLGLGDLIVVVKGRVVHSHISDIASDLVAYHSGIEFVDVSNTVRDAIAQHVAKLRAERRG